MDDKSVLGKARAEGYEAGRKSYGDFLAQYAEALDDESYYRGYCEGLATADEQAPRRLTWFCFGIIVGNAPFIPWSNFL